MIISWTCLKYNLNYNIFIWENYLVHRVFRFGFWFFNFPWAASASFCFCAFCCCFCNFNSSCLRFFSAAAAFLWFFLSSISLLFWFFSFSSDSEYCAQSSDVATLGILRFVRFFFSLAHLDCGQNSVLAKASAGIWLSVVLCEPVIEKCISESQFRRPKLISTIVYKMNRRKINQLLESWEPL